MTHISAELPPVNYGDDEETSDFQMIDPAVNRAALEAEIRFEIQTDPREIKDRSAYRQGTRRYKPSHAKAERDRQRAARV